jgi:acetyl-CoA carboxylase biotin carboxyl carrier protein|tara:strand:+ start:34 stop:507 length:474 start_codon:yes stop_codon:yes gene_type:complete
MKVKEIRDLIDYIKSTGLEEVNIETETFKIKIKRSSEVVSQPQFSPPTILPQSLPKQSLETLSEGAVPSSKIEGDENYITIKSPMIGTIYMAPNPESPNFIKVGDVIKPGDTVCVVEAMKLFNEIEAEISGTVVKILAENANPVEYDQPLFLIDPSK